MEPGVQAMDNYEGDLSDQVIVKGEVDIHQPGVYTLQYVVEDSSGNRTQIERTVYVLSNDATLKQLSIRSGKLFPDFAPDGTTNKYSFSIVRESGNDSHPGESPSQDQDERQDHQEEQKESEEQDEVLTIDVESGDGEEGDSITQTTVHRTTHADGSVSDEAIFTEDR